MVYTEEEQVFVGKVLRNQVGLDLSKIEYDDKSRVVTFYFRGIKGSKYVRRQLSKNFSEVDEILAPKRTADRIVELLSRDYLSDSEMAIRARISSSIQNANRKEVDLRLLPFGTPLHELESVKLSLESESPSNRKKTILRVDDKGRIMQIHYNNEYPLFPSERFERLE